MNRRPQWDIIFPVSLALDGCHLGTHGFTTKHKEAFER